MNQNRSYKLRAYETERDGFQDEELQATAPVAAPRSKSSGKHQQKGSSWQVETFLDSRKTHGITGARHFWHQTKNDKASADAAHLTGGGSATLPLFDSPPDCQTPPSKAQRKRKTRKRWFAPKPKAPEISPLDSGSTTVPDILAPASADFTNRDYIVVDGVYHAYLYITGYGYNSAVTSGWLNPLVEIGEGVNLSFTIKRQQKDKVLPKIAQTTMVNRSRMRDVGDTRQDYEELDSAINSGLWIRIKINFYAYEFCVA